MVVKIWLRVSDLELIDRLRESPNIKWAALLDIHHNIEQYLNEIFGLEP
ncbi:MAG: hypothetical protein ACXACK_19265 [Candidatus Hodarchaeales archaeon]